MKTLEELLKEIESIKPEILPDGRITIVEWVNDDEANGST